MEHITNENKNLKEKIIPIIKVIHNRENRPLMLPTKAVLDSDLSLEALGLYVRLFAMKEEVLNPLTLSHICNESVGFIEECMIELRERGYLASDGGES